MLDAFPAGDDGTADAQQRSQLGYERAGVFGGFQVVHKNKVGSLAQQAGKGHVLLCCFQRQDFPAAELPSESIEQEIKIKNGFANLDNLFSRKLFELCAFANDPLEVLADYCASCKLACQGCLPKPTKPLDHHNGDSSWVLKRCQQTLYLFLAPRKWVVIFLWNGGRPQPLSLSGVILLIWLRW